MGYDAGWLARQVQKPGYHLVDESGGRVLKRDGCERGWATAQAEGLPSVQQLISGEPVLTIILPYPPSINHYYVPVARGKQVLSQAGRDYRQAVSSAVTQQQPVQAPLTGRLSILLELHPPDQHIRDLDNTEKALLDALTHAGIYLDDRQIDDKRTLRRPQHQPPYVRVTLAQRSATVMSQPEQGGPPCPLHRSPTTIPATSAALTPPYPPPPPTKCSCCVAKCC